MGLSAHETLERWLLIHRCVLIGSKIGVYEFRTFLRFARDQLGILLVSTGNANQTLAATQL